MVTLIHILLLFCLVSCLWPTGTGSVQVELAPSSVNVCPGSEIVLKCTVTEADRNITRWRIFPESITYSAVDLTLSNTLHLNERYVYEMETNIRAEWISFSPLLCSMFMANASIALDGAVVECSYSFSLMEYLTITLKDVPTLQWLDSTITVLQVDNVTVIVEWESNQLSQIDYIVTISPPVENGSLSTITTSQRSHRFTIPYNNTYTITVVGSNCAGKSNQLNETFSFVKCEAPYLGENVLEVGELDEPFLNDSQMHLSCSSGHSVINEYDLLITCTCGTDTSCEWLPDPAQLQCLRDCGHLLSRSDLYTVINETISTVEGSTIHFECLKDALNNVNTTLLLTHCLSNGLWYPDPNDVCKNERKGDSGSSVVYLAVVTLFVSLIFLGTFTILSVIVCKKKISKERSNNNIIMCQGQEQSSVDVLTRNVSYELTTISQNSKPRIGIEKNSAYVSSSTVAGVLHQEVELEVDNHEYETIYR